MKVCCIGSVAEAWLAIEQGASALGLVSDMPSGPGVIDDALIAEIAAAVPPGISSVLLTSRQDVESIVDQQRRLRVNAIQICDRLPSGSHLDLHEALPGISLIQVIHVTGPESVDEAVSASQFVDAIPLDSGNQSLPVKELGCTGRTHDWSLRRRIRQALDVPVFLAVGLDGGDVVQAIREVGPFAVDVCSGVRTGQNLDATKLAEFFRSLAAL